MPRKLKTFPFHFCARCGFVSSPKNKKKFKEDGSNFATSSNPGVSRRSGDGVRGGREFFMLETAIEILGRSDLEVLFYGSGLSLDHLLARKLPQVATSHVTDLHNYQESDGFIPLDSTRRFDVVICCEVVEHFERPRRDFRELLKFAKSDGLVVCSTNVNDGTPVEEVAYPWSRGHTSYYSGASLLDIARQNGQYCDFRLPECALRDPGPRKRYVFFFQDPENQNRISEAFSRLPLAYSEKATNQRRRARQASADAATFSEVIATTKAWGGHAFRWRLGRLKRQLRSGWKP
jgi:SAM-dependent methyltransferase